ncbi:DUF6444 domain-containing protein [Streptomyces sp. NBC_00996]|uniref:DUF6444 domain-containing protein n=1 Tax=Streptomyces sp. NBC_00996 TaxID=2903710 RepID=UPI00386A04B6
MQCQKVPAVGWVDLVTSAQPPQPSHEELAALIAEFKLVISAQAERIAELERQLAANSHNLSKPPSSDGMRKKPAPKSLRKSSGRKPGRARGPGARLEQVAGPDTIIDSTKSYAPKPSSPPAPDTLRVAACGPRRRHAARQQSGLETLPNWDSLTDHITPSDSHS